MKVDALKMWATSGTGEDFQCVHIDDARDLENELMRQINELKAIKGLYEEMKGE